ncbi:MAG: hypothetical protein ACJ741_17360 [Pyrinomonadaceae bacterium]
MARDEAKGRRASKTETPENVPLVSAKRGKFESLKDAKVEAVIFARLGEYKAFVQEMEGEEPEEGAIISAGLEMLFAADKGFERWQGEQRKRERQAGERGAAASSLRTPASSPSAAGGAT